MSTDTVVRPVTPRPSATSPARTPAEAMVQMSLYGHTYLAYDPHPPVQSFDQGLDRLLGIVPGQAPPPPPRWRRLLARLRWLNLPCGEWRGWSWSPSLRATALAFGADLNLARDHVYLSVCLFGRGYIVQWEARS